jgi:flagellar biogenesis protein FliO
MRFFAIRHTICTVWGMKSSKKMVVLSLVLVLLLCAARMVSSAQKRANCADADTNSLLNLLSDDSSCQNENEKPSLLVGSNSNVSVKGLFYKMLVMVLLMLVLGAAVIYVSRKLLPKINLPGKKIQIAETVHLGNRKSLHLVKIGSKTILVGSTNESITNLADVSEQMMELEE